MQRTAGCSLPAFVCQTRWWSHARRELSGRSRWFRESRVWVTRWRADNARNFGFEFCATIVTAHHAAEAVAGCSAAGCNDVWLWLWVVVRVVGISIIYLPTYSGLGSDLCCAGCHRRNSPLPRHSWMPTWIRRWWWVPCYVMSIMSLRTCNAVYTYVRFILTLLIYWLDHSCPVSIFLFFENLGVYQIIV